MTMTIVDKSGTMAECSLTHSDVPPWSLQFECASLGHCDFSGADLFECLRQLREWLAARNNVILCNGARVDAWPSSMARQMGGARKVYITRMGFSTTSSDLVPTFGETSLDSLGTVEEQAAYHQRWLESLRQQVR